MLRTLREPSEEKKNASASIFLNKSDVHMCVHPWRLNYFSVRCTVFRFFMPLTLVPVRRGEWNCYVTEWWSLKMGAAWIFESLVGGKPELLDKVHRYLITQVKSRSIFPVLIHWANSELIYWYLLKELMQVTVVTHERKWYYPWIYI